MKIYIGKYIDGIHLNWHRDYMRSRHGYSWDIGDEYKQTRFEKFLERLDDVCQSVLDYTLNRYLYSRKRKIRIWIDPYDIWSGDHTLALIILPMLKLLKEKKSGSPLVSDEDVPADLGIRSTDCVKKNDWDWDENCHKRWEWVMNELIWTFEQLVDDRGDLKFFENGKFDMEGLKEYEGRVQRGLILFGKYFRSLSD